MFAQIPLAIIYLRNITNQGLVCRKFGSSCQSRDRFEPTPIQGSIETNPFQQNKNTMVKFGYFLFKSSRGITCSQVLVV